MTTTPILTRLDHTRSDTPDPGGPGALDLPAASWSTSLHHAPRDDEPHARTMPARLRARVPVPLHRSLGMTEAPFARLPVDGPTGAPLWVPVIGGAPGWARVLLPTRPAGATGWVRLTGEVDQRAHPVHLLVDTRARMLTLTRRGDSRAWPVGVGRANNPTPRGRTFVLGELAPRAGLVDHALALAVHAPTHLAHGAGLAVIGLHTWPGLDVAPLLGSDGCVLVPADVMPILTACALPGTAVLIR